jgi:hypothetical protein
MSSRERTRIWHERKTARGECHAPGCRNRTDHWYCWSCGIAISQMRAFARFVKRAAMQKCVECPRFHRQTGLLCRRCKHKKKGLNATHQRMRSCTLRATPETLASLRPLPFAEPEADSVRSFSQ